MIFLLATLKRFLLVMMKNEFFIPDKFLNFKIKNGKYIKLEVTLYFLEEFGG